MYPTCIFYDVHCLAIFFFFCLNTHYVRIRVRCTLLNTSNRETCEKTKKDVLSSCKKTKQTAKNTIHNFAVNRYTIYFKDRFLEKIWNTFFSHTLIIAIICRLQVFKSIFFPLLFLYVISRLNTPHEI